MKICCKNCDYELCDINGFYTCTYCGMIGPWRLIKYASTMLCKQL